MVWGPEIGDLFALDAPHSRLGGGFIVNERQRNAGGITSKTFLDYHATCKTLLARVESVTTTMSSVSLNSTSNEKLRLFGVAQWWASWESAVRTFPSTFTASPTKQFPNSGLSRHSLHATVRQRPLVAT